MKADYEFQRAFEEFEKADDLKGMYVSMEYKVRVRKENEDLHQEYETEEAVAAEKKQKYLVSRGQGRVANKPRVFGDKISLLTEVIIKNKTNRGN